MWRAQTVFSDTGSVFFGTTFTETTFGAGDVLEIKASNDNNQGWGFDVWYSTDGTPTGIVESLADIPVGTSTLLSISLSGVTASAWGVSVHSIISQGDYFHASWSPIPGRNPPPVPLPASLPLFGTALVGLLGWRRKSKSAA